MPSSRLGGLTVSQPMTLAPATRTGTVEAGAMADTDVRFRCGMPAGLTSAVVTQLMSASQIFAGLALIVGLAVACQTIAASLRIPAIILLLPVGFAAGALTTVVNPGKIFGAAFPPLVGLAVPHLFDH